MKTSDLTDAQLDYWVAKADGLQPLLTTLVEDLSPVCVVGYDPYRPSTDWALGGQIIERERIGLAAVGGVGWMASCGQMRAAGETALVASMRAFVVEKIGDEVS